MNLCLLCIPLLVGKGVIIFFSLILFISVLFPCVLQHWL